MTSKNVKAAKMVTTQDFSTLGLPSLLLQFDSFLLGAVNKVDQPYLLVFCGSAKNREGSSSALRVAVRVEE